MKDPSFYTDSLQSCWRVLFICLFSNLKRISFWLWKRRKVLPPLFFLPLILFVWFWPCHRVFGALSSLTRDRTQAPAVEAWGPNHWTTREFPLPPIWKCEEISLSISRRGWELRGGSGLWPKKDQSVQLRISCGQVTERKLSWWVKESYTAQNSLELKPSSRSSPPFYAKQRTVSAGKKKKKKTLRLITPSSQRVQPLAQLPAGPASGWSPKFLAPAV